MHTRTVIVNIANRILPYTYQRNTIAMLVFSDTNTSIGVVQVSHIGTKCLPTISCVTPDCPGKTPVERVS